jgi:hypothetical protein
MKGEISAFRGNYSNFGSGIDDGPKQPLFKYNDLWEEIVRPLSEIVDIPKRV